MLRFNHIAYRHGSEATLQDVDFRVSRGAYEGLIGPSGCGKTTLIKLITGLERPANGSIEHDFQRLGIVCQNDSLIEEISILRNITFVCNDSKVAERCLALVGLGDLPLRTRAATLSKGMKKRVEIARALSVSPDFLVMDEPFSGLDHVAKYALIAQMKHFLEEIDTTFLYVTHDISEALLICDHLTVLSARPARVLERFENIQRTDKRLLKQTIIKLLER